MLDLVEFTCGMRLELISRTDDDVVPYRYAVNANKLFPNSQLVRVNGGTHWIDDSFNKTAFPAIERFLR